MSVQNQNNLYDINLYPRGQDTDRKEVLDKGKRKEKKNLKKFFIIFGICLIVILIAFILIYFLIIRKREKNPPIEDEPTQSEISNIIQPKKN